LLSNIGGKSSLRKIQEMKMKWTNMFVYIGLLAIGLTALNTPASAAYTKSDGIGFGTTSIVAASESESDFLLASKRKFDRKKFKGFDKDDFKKGRFDKDDIKKFDKDDFKRFDRFKKFK
jgi:hypothetical protein